MELWFSEFHTPDVKHSLRVNRHLYSKKSDYQQIDIYDTPEFGKVLTLDGNVMLTERDEFIYDEMITHVPMAVHPNVQDVLVIGAGDGGVVKELARYECIQSIDLVEMDEQVVNACRQYLPENACRLDDKRVHIYFDNALRFIRRRAAQPQAHRQHVPHQPGLPGPHPHLCRRLLAVRLCQQEVPPHR